MADIPDMNGTDSNAGILDDVAISLARAANGRHGRSLILIAEKISDRRRMLDRIANHAATHDTFTIRLNGRHHERLTADLARDAGHIIDRLDDDTARRTLNGFRRAHNIGKTKGITTPMTEPGIADSGLADLDVPELLSGLTKAAKAARKPIALLIDDMHRMALPTMGILITALHKTSQNALPLVMIASGTEALRPMPATARSYAERMFSFQVINRRPDADQSADPATPRLSVPAPARPARPGNTGP